MRLSAVARTKVLALLPGGAPAEKATQPELAVPPPHFLGVPLSGNLVVRKQLSYRAALDTALLQLDPR